MAIGSIIEKSGDFPGVDNPQTSFNKYVMTDVFEDVIKRVKAAKGGVINPLVTDCNTNISLTNVSKEQIASLLK